MKLFLLFIACTALIMSCAGTDSSGEFISSCAEITCSGHGECISNDGIPECKCDDGYINTGSECILDCSSISNSVANVYNNACECKIGFEAVKDESGALTSCGCEGGKVLKNGVCTLECDDPHAIATASGQSCICDTGYISVGSICTFDCRNISNSYPNDTNDGCECEFGYEKNGDECIYTCNKDGNMKANSSNTGCECEDGFFQTKELDVCVNSCSNVTCEENSTCKPYSSESFLCECNPERNFELKFSDTNVYAANAPLDFKVATNNGNSYALVWSANGVSGVTNIFMIITDSNGVPLTEADGSTKVLRVSSDDTSIVAVTPVVIWAGDKYMVGWEDRRYSTPEKLKRDIFTRFVTESGELEGEYRVTFKSNNEDSYAHTPKLLWNSAQNSYVIFWKEQAWNGNVPMPNSSIFYKVIISVQSSIIEPTILTDINVNDYDYDVIVNNEGDYSMVWTRGSSRNLMYQVINSDKAAIDSNGVIKKMPIPLTYNPSHKMYTPRLIWTGDEYAVFYRNSSVGNYLNMARLNSSHQKVDSELSLNISYSVRDVFWVDNEFLMSWNSSRRFTTLKASWNGQSRKTFTSSDSFANLINSRLIPLNKNDKSVFWMDDRTGKYEIYFSKLGCF